VHYNSTIAEGNSSLRTVRSWFRVPSRAPEPRANKKVSSTKIRVMYDISYKSWNRMFHFGLGGLNSRACHLGNFYQTVFNLASTDGKSRILSPSGGI
jgi:hypothetical protein